VIGCAAPREILALPVHRHEEPEATARGVGVLIADQPADWKVESKVQLFAPTAQPQLLGRYFAWLKEMKRAI
jgi:hypothetical protein